MHNINKLKKNTLKITKYTSTHSELKANITQKVTKIQERNDMKKLYISEPHERNQSYLNSSDYQNH